MKSPPTDLAARLLDVSEQILRADPPLRLEDVALLVGASRATLYYYFSGRDDLLAFPTTHAKEGAEAVRDSIDDAEPPERRLRAMIAAMIAYLGHRPGICAGLLGALGGTGRMGEVLQANDTWIAGPLRELLADGRRAGTFTADDITDAANAILGAVLLGVLGRSMSGTDSTDPHFRRQLTEQAVRGVLAR